MPTKAKSTSAPLSEDAIRQRAYHLWEADGKPDGKADHYWHKASEPLDEKARSKASATASKAAAALKGGNPAETKPTKAKAATKPKAAAAKATAPAIKAKPAAKAKAKKSGKD